MTTWNSHIRGKQKELKYWEAVEEKFGRDIKELFDRDDCSCLVCGDQVPTYLSRTPVVCGKECFEEVYPEDVE